MSEFNKKNTKKFFLIVIMIIAAFVLIVSLASLYTQRVVSCGLTETCTIPLPFLIPIIASVSLFVGSLIGYLMVGKLYRKEKDITEYSKLIKKVFTKEECVILKLIDENKSISQARIVQSTKYPRLKVFRIIEKLKEKGIIEKKEKNGKTWMINLNKEFCGLFENCD